MSKGVVTSESDFRKVLMGQSGSLMPEILRSFPNEIWFVVSIQTLVVNLHRSNESTKNHLFWISAAAFQATDFRVITHGTWTQRLCTPWRYVCYPFASRSWFIMIIAVYIVVILSSIAKRESLRCYLQVLEIFWDMYNIHVSRMPLKKHRWTTFARRGFSSGICRSIMAMRTLG